MNALVEEARRLRNRAKVQRKRGDAQRKKGNEDLAVKAFEDGLKMLEDAVGKLLSLDEDEQVPEDLAETLGAKAGMLRRFRDERQHLALGAYEEGAVIEKDNDLSSTYNRLNYLKTLLLTGQKKLEALKPKIKELSSFIEKKLRSDPGLSGWAWADLGDCQALLGNLESAEAAYTNFINMAEIKSPETALKVLNELANKIAQNDDPGSQSVREAANTLQAQLVGVGTAK